VPYATPGPLSVNPQRGPARAYFRGPIHGESGLSKTGSENAYFGMAVKHTIPLQGFPPPVAPCRP
jgi:hypothetical protein